MNSDAERMERQIPGDVRLYLSQPDGWRAHVKQGWEREYCYSQHPGEDHFHLLMNGEIYLQRANEKFCLTCALRRGYLTTDRLNWQRANRRARKQDL